METRSTLIAAITTLATTFVAVALLDVGSPTLDALGPTPWVSDASTGSALGSGTAEPVPSIHDLVQPLQRIAFGSCNDQSMEQPLWKNIAAHTPELWLWMGDNIYGDIREAHEPMPTPPAKTFIEATGDVLRERYAKLQAHPDYRAFVQTTPVIGIWDDHDFGINDAHKGYTYREESQQIFLDFMNEPADSPRRQQEGIYTSYTVGEGEQTVKFILVDNRYNRDTYETEGGNLLGAAQWAWLENELRTTTAAFNVIVSGIQILANDRFNMAEGWSRFPDQRERLLELLLASKAKGVILLSGDVHFSEINQVVCPGGDNVITEITSSGMTHSWMQFHRPEIRFFPALLFTFANLILPWEFRPTHDALYGYINWGQIEFDWTRKPYPVATVQVRGRDDAVKLQYEFASKPVHSDSPAEDAAACRPTREMAVWERVLRQLVFAGVTGLSVLSLLVNVVVALWLGWFVASTLVALVVRFVKKQLAGGKRVKVE
ncbi:hypothetical protein PybrP1_000072 [[Pythium] brassicae (nom. inval.)]|nr:hypothetical protein PybrP1_000072 [[Pythium] brassicae (nom. inval.)]